MQGQSLLSGCCRRMMVRSATRLLRRHPGSRGLHRHSLAHQIDVPAQVVQLAGIVARHTQPANVGDRCGRTRPAARPDRNCAAAAVEIALQRLELLVPVHHAPPDGPDVERREPRASAAASAPACPVSRPASPCVIADEGQYRRTARPHAVRHAAPATPARRQLARLVDDAGLARRPRTRGRSPMETRPGYENSTGSPFLSNPDFGLCTTALVSRLTRAPAACPAARPGRRWWPAA